jgi:hypothetical protein
LDSSKPRPGFGGKEDVLSNADDISDWDEADVSAVFGVTPIVAQDIALPKGHFYGLDVSCIFSFIVNHNLVSLSSATFPEDITSASVRFSSDFDIVDEDSALFDCHGVSGNCDDPLDPVLPTFFGVAKYNEFTGLRIAKLIDPFVGVLRDLLGGVSIDHDIANESVKSFLISFHEQSKGVWIAVQRAAYYRRFIDVHSSQSSLGER